MPIKGVSDRASLVGRPLDQRSQSFQSSPTQQQKYQTIEPKQLSKSECGMRIPNEEATNVFQQTAQRIYEMGRAFFSKSEEPARVSQEPQRSELQMAVDRSNARYGKNESFINRYGERVFL